MKPDLVDILACPDDKAPLSLEATSQDGGEVIEGILTCTQCGFQFPIEEGVPNLLPQAMHTDGVTDAE